GNARRTRHDRDRRRLGGLLLIARSIPAQRRRWVAVEIRQRFETRGRGRLGWRRRKGRDDPLVEGRAFGRPEIGGGGLRTGRLDRIRQVPVGNTRTRWLLGKPSRIELRLNHRAVALLLALGLDDRWRSCERCF